MTLSGSSVIYRPPSPPDVDGDDGGRDCPYWPRHLPVVVYTRRPLDLFRRRLWLRCWVCDLKEGPYETDAMANFERELIER